MKGVMKLGAVLGMVSMLGACSSMTTIAERNTYAQPKWYAECEQIGTEGWFFWTKEQYVYACGMGESIYEQQAEAEAYAFAKKGLAERVNGSVESSTVVKITDESKSTNTVVKNLVEKTTIREDIQVRKHTYKLGGKYYNFTRLKLSKEVFDTLINEAKTGNVDVAAN